MSIDVHESLLRFVLTKSEDPEIKERQRLIAKVCFDMMTPEAKDEMIAKARREAYGRSFKESFDKGRMDEARSVLQRVLARRKLVLGAEEQARIEACTDLATLRRWHDQAVEALSAAEALQ